MSSAFVGLRSKRERLRYLHQEKTMGSIRPFDVHASSRRSCPSGAGGWVLRMEGRARQSGPNLNLAQCPFPASNLGIRGSESRRKRDPLAEVFVEWRVDSVRERENLSMYLCSRAVMPSASLQETVRPVHTHTHMSHTYKPTSHTPTSHTLTNITHTHTHTHMHTYTTE